MPDEHPAEQFMKELVEKGPAGMPDYVAGTKPERTPTEHIRPENLGGTQ